MSKNRRVKVAVVFAEASSVDADLAQAMLENFAERLADYGKPSGMKFERLAVSRMFIPKKKKTKAAKEGEEAKTEGPPVPASPEAQDATKVATTEAASSIVDGQTRVEGDPPKGSDTTTTTVPEKKKRTYANKVKERKNVKYSVVRQFKDEDDDLFEKESSFDDDDSGRDKLARRELKEKEKRKKALIGKSAKEREPNPNHSQGPRKQRDRDDEEVRFVLAFHISYNTHRTSSSR